MANRTNRSKKLCAHRLPRQGGERRVHAGRPQATRKIVSHGTGGTTPETFPLVPVIEDVGKTIEPMATKNGNRIVIDCPADLGTMHADQTRFRQALLNITLASPPAFARRDSVWQRKRGLKFLI